MTWTGTGCATPPATTYTMRLVPAVTMASFGTRSAFLLVPKLNVAVASIPLLISNFGLRSSIRTGKVRALRSPSGRIAEISPVNGSFDMLATLIRTGLFRESCTAYRSGTSTVTLICPRSTRVTTGPPTSIHSPTCVCSSATNPAKGATTVLFRISSFNSSISTSVRRSSCLRD